MITLMLGYVLLLSLHLRFFALETVYRAQQHLNPLALTYLMGAAHTFLPVVLWS